jgi:hypothetical protein
VDDAGTITELRILEEGLREGLGAEIGASVVLELHGKLYVPLHDTRGNIVTLLDESGTVVESYRHDAFGNDTIFQQAMSIKISINSCFLRQLISKKFSIKSA